MLGLLTVRGLFTGAYRGYVRLCRDYVGATSSLGFGVRGLACWG